jgi:glycerol uptake facilitator-like aquaporin
MLTFIVGLVAWLVGTVLLAAPFIRRRLHPRWVGYPLPASGIWVVVGNLIIAPSGPASNLAVNLASNLGPVLLLVAIGYLGHRMRSGHDAASTATIGRTSA